MSNWKLYLLTFVWSSMNKLSAHQLIILNCGFSTKVTDGFLGAETLDNKGNL